MLGILGKSLVSLSFVLSLIAAIIYFYSAQKDDKKLFKIGNIFFGLKGLFLLAASGILIYLTVSHQFQYYYVFNYTSRDLAFKYLLSAFYGGQEGSFMLWILFSWILGFGLMRWTRPPYQAPVLFFMAFTQVFLLSMILGWDLSFLKLGASPFRTIAEEMPNAPFLQANPNFIPTDGTGLNDLLKSPWMMIHPPILFLGFAMMTIPYCFAMAALWKRKYHEWVGPALPWTLTSNVALLTAIFLGGYWAYVTLSFGGFWAWDPVENASLVPWLLGTAGIHTMIIQRKSSVAQKSSLLFAILAYMAIVYETFLTRSGILANASVHSFVDLGLYNQLLLFMLAISILGIGLFLYRYKELPSPQKESAVFSREFFTFSGAVLLFVLSAVILLGTSSPIIGRLFSENPTPPEIAFYNNWSMPIVMLMALMTVIGQFLFWQKHTPESLASKLIIPLLFTSLLSTISILSGDVHSLYHMLYIFCGYFALTGNAAVMIALIKKNPKLIGGSLTHVGFGVLLIGIIASTGYNSPIVDEQTSTYNAAVERGEVVDEAGFKVQQKQNMMLLNLNEPKIVNGEYAVTYEGYRLDNQNRPGQQTYSIKFESISSGSVFYLNPEVYPMLSGGTAPGGINWSVDPDVYSGITSDLYVYVAGSRFVEQRNQTINERTGAISVSTEEPGADSLRKISLSQGQTTQVNGYSFRFVNYLPADSVSLPDDTILGVRAEVEVIHDATRQLVTVEPLFAVYSKGNMVLSPPEGINEFGLALSFTKISTQENRIELTVAGLPKEQDWVLIVAEKKPFISAVWLGTFLLMGGFSLSILRHWQREKSKQD